MNFGQKKLNIVHVVTFVDAYIYPYICYFPHEKKRCSSKHICNS